MRLEALPPIAAIKRKFGAEKLNSKLDHSTTDTQHHNGDCYACGCGTHQAFDSSSSISCTLPCCCNNNWCYWYINPAQVDYSHNSGPPVYDSTQYFAYDCPHNSHEWDPFSCNGVQLSDVRAAHPYPVLILHQNTTFWETQAPVVNTLNRFWSLHFTPYTLQDTSGMLFHNVTH